MNAIGVIPARYGASRLPGKPLVPIAGRPMIQHVWERASGARSLAALIIATDDERVAEICRNFGADVRMTRRDHVSGTDRVAEVAGSLSADIVVNVQGDEPLIEGRVIDAAVAALANEPSVEIATLAHPIDATAVADPNRVKVLIDERGLATAFSRAPFADAAGRDGRAALQHVGLYAYRHRFLQRFVALPPTAGELEFGLEQLRAHEAGYPICVAIIEGWQSRPVDVAADIADVERALAADERHPLAATAR